MARRPIRGRIGTKRITKGLRPSQGDYTRNVRNQMKSIEDALAQVVLELKGVTPNVLESALRPTLNRSLVYVPKDTKALANSAYLVVKEGTYGVQAEIGYGKSSQPPYAVYVHEMTGVRHASPTKAKFLQAAIEEDSQNIPERIRKGYRKGIGMA